MPTDEAGKGEAEPAEFKLPAHSAFRPTARDHRKAAIVARAVVAAGFDPTPTVVLRAALAIAARDLDVSSVLDGLSLDGRPIEKPEKGPHLGQLYGPYGPLNRLPRSGRP